MWLSPAVALADEKHQEWLDLVAKITNINLVDGRDHFRWNLNKYGIFTVGSIYLHKMNQHTPFCHKLILKLKISLKIKIFFWYLQRGVILTLLENRLKAPVARSLWYWFFEPVPRLWYRVKQPVPKPLKFTQNILFGWDLNSRPLASHVAPLSS